MAEGGIVCEEGGSGVGAMELSIWAGFRRSTDITSC